MAEFMMVRRLRENSSKHRRPLDLTELTDAQLVEQYRFSYSGIQRIAELLHEELADGRVHRSKVSPELQVACALGYVASPGFFSNVGFPLGLSKSTAYVAAMGVLQALANRADEFLRWPSDEEMRISEAEFRAREGRLHGRLLGDAAYPVKSWLLPPIPNPATPVEHRYNQVHGRERRLVEQTYGQFKRSCHSMHSEVRVTGERVPMVVMAALVLCRLRIDWGEAANDEDGNRPVEAPEVEVPIAPAPNHLRAYLQTYAHLFGGFG